MRRGYGGCAGMPRPRRGPVSGPGRMGAGGAVVTGSAAMEGARPTGRDEPDCAGRPLRGVCWSSSSEVPAVRDAPAGPAGPPPEQGEHGWRQHRANQEGVEQQPDRHRERELPEGAQRDDRHHREGGGEDQTRGADRPRGGRHRAGDGAAEWVPCGLAPDGSDGEHVVVRTEGQQQHGRREHDVEGQAGGAADVLEDEHGESEGRDDAEGAAGQQYQRCEERAQVQDQDQQLDPERDEHGDQQVLPGDRREFGGDGGLARHADGDVAQAGGVGERRQSAVERFEVLDASRRRAGRPRRRRCSAPPCRPGTARPRIPPATGSAPVRGLRATPGSPAIEACRRSSASRWAVTSGPSTRISVGAVMPPTPYRRRAGPRPPERGRRREAGR